MTPCAFTTTPTPDGRFQQTCKGGCFTVRSAVYHRECDCGLGVKMGECAHIGPVVGLIECESCAGKTSIKVFSCALHGQCTHRTRLDSRPTCATCPDAVKPQTPAISQEIAPAAQDPTVQGRRGGRAPNDPGPAE